MNYPFPKKMNCPITKDIPKKKNKYKNEKVTIDGITFDSKKEGNRYKELKLLEKGKTISDLQLQVAYTLIPSYQINGKETRETKYIADFVYFEGGELIIEDVKSSATKTQVYKLKKKLFEFKYGVEIKEV